MTSRGNQSAAARRRHPLLAHPLQLCCSFGKPGRGGCSCCVTICCSCCVTISLEQAARHAATQTKDMYKHTHIYGGIEGTREGMQKQTQISKAQQMSTDDIMCFCTSSCASIGTFVLANHYIFVVLLVYLAAFADSLSSAVDVEREPLVRSSCPAFPAAARQHRYLHP